MKKLFLLLSMLPLFIFGQNLILNPGFEEDPFDTEWVKITATLSDTTEVHSGSHACKVVSTDKNKGIKSKNYITGQDGLYLLSAWVKADAGLELKIQNVLETADDGNQTLNTKYITTGEWQHIGVSFTAEAADQFKMVILTSQEAGTFIVDDIEIIKTETIVNADFEAGIDQYWSTVTLKNDAKATVEESVMDGDTTLKVNVLEKGNPGAVGDILVNSFSLIPFNSSSKVISFKAKADMDDTSTIGVAGFGSGYKNEYGKHQAGENNYGGTFNMSDEYRTYSWAIGATDYALYQFANVSLRFGPELGAYYIDDITVTDYTGAPAINSTPVETADTLNEYSYQATMDATEMIGKWGLSKPIGLGSLTIDQYTGLISGKPDTVGVFDIVVNLNTGIDSIGQAYTLTITGGASALSEVENSKLSVFPTVTKDWITINSANISDVKIYSLSGKLVNNITLQNNRMNLSHLSNGVYIIHTEKQQALIIKQ